jgi:hypothetical protein
VTALTTANIEVGIDGKQWVIINRIKTGTRSAIPLLPIALELLIKYNYKLPVCSNQKLNKYLKEVAAICNINKNLTSHTQEVLDKYKTDPACIADHKLLPVCTNQRINGYLKVD